MMRRLQGYLSTGLRRTLADLPVLKFGFWSVVASLFFTFPASPDVEFTRDVMEQLHMAAYSINEW